MTEPIDQPTDERLEALHRPQPTPELVKALTSGRTVEITEDQPSSWWSRRWMTVSIIAILAVIGYLLAGNFTESHRNQRQIDKVRLPVCSIMYTALSHAPQTRAQADVRKDYLTAYGPSGLNCPKPLPEVVG